MKYLSIFSLVFMVLSCQPAAPKQENTATTATPIVTQQDSAQIKANAAKCQMKGKLVEKFEQNNALFERLSNEEKEMEWLKITTKDGKCTVIDDIAQANHYSVTFEDWDKDGMKDRLNNWKWHYEVFLFDKTKNDFSRHIEGIFNGDQWDFDKSQNLKYQLLENKYGGIYELYQLKDGNKTVLSEISFSNDEADNNPDSKTEIRKNIVKKGDDIKFDTLKMDANLYVAMHAKTDEDYDAQLARSKKGVETYWRKNLSLFLKK